jgi:putative transposase
MADKNLQLWDAPKQFPSSSKHLWSPSYFASSCGGAPIEVLKQYIQNQK